MKKEKKCKYCGTVLVYILDTVQPDQMSEPASLYQCLKCKRVQTV